VGGGGRGSGRRWRRGCLGLRESGRRAEGRSECVLGEMGAGDW